MKSTMTDKELDEAIHSGVSMGLDNIDRHLEGYLSNQKLPTFYAQYIARCKKDHINHIFTYEDYVANAYNFIKKYVELNRSRNNNVLRGMIPAWTEVKKIKQTINSYYAVYREIINLAEKGPINNDSTPHEKLIRNVKNKTSLALHH